MHATAVKLLHQLNRVHHVAPQPGQAVNYHHVAFAHSGQQLVEGGALGTGADTFS